MKFLHTADCHLDALLRGLEQYEGCPADRIRHSTRDAFANIVALAIDEAVDFVVIAGDLFDGDWTNQQTALWAATQFRRLQKEGIEVFLIRGNHDAMAESRQSITWPENVHEFPVSAAETVRIDRLGVALHGRGFAGRETTADLASEYPPAVPGLFNIGILHTSLAGDPRHDTYAPTSERVLVGKDYDYWALGHVHTYRQVRERDA
jgi:DNA repair exonuclease SbcCD nuclease subunit